MNFLSRIARRKDGARAEPEEGHEIPPPAAIEPGVAYATGNPEDKGLGSHREVELLSETESEASPEEPEPSHDDEAAASAAAHNAVEAFAPEPEAVDDAVTGDQETRTAPVVQDSPDEDEPPLSDEETDSEIAESAAVASAPEPKISGESELAEDITEEVGEPFAAAVMPESPDESPQPALAENGIFSLVRDARGVWRPGRGFSRGELREAGLSPADASRLHIRFDKRRRNTHPVNVASLEQARSGV